MLWYERGNLSPLYDISPVDTVCLDTETTGLNPRSDEVLQLAIIRGDETVVLCDLFGADRHRAWPGAQRVHGITPQDVEGKPSLRSRREEVSEAIGSARLIVGYNLAFDLSFLRAIGVDVPRCLQFDVMREFAPVAGRRNARRRRFSWVKLGECARYYGFDFRAHDALEDARATLWCFRGMLEFGDFACGHSGSVSYLEVACGHSRGLQQGTQESGL